jgi:hypothetical protein
MLAPGDDASKCGTVSEEIQELKGKPQRESPQSLDTDTSQLTNSIREERDQIRAYYKTVVSPLNLTNLTENLLIDIWTAAKIT